MKKTMKLKVLAAAALSVICAQSAFAQVSNASIVISANTDNTPNTEGVFIYSNDSGTNPGASAKFITSGNAEIFGSNTAFIQSTGSTVSTTGNNASVTANGTATISSTGTTSINAATGNGNVSIGNNVNTVSIQGANNNITGTTNTVTGTTNINSNTGNTSATSINTGNSTGAVTIGNAANVTNINSGTNNIGAGYASTNNIGTGAFATTTNIGNAVTTTQVHATGGNAQMNLANNSASLTVPSGVTGVNNGFSATNTNASMTGGNASPTRMTMNDNGATFSRVSTGAPVTVTGVADGRSDFDAVNVRQFAGAVAAVAAQANVPSLAAGQDRTIGLGLGNFMGKTGLALGMNLRDQNTVYKLTVSSSLHEGAQTVIAGGAAWAW